MFRNLEMKNGNVYTYAIKNPEDLRPYNKIIWTGKNGKKQFALVKDAGEAEGTTFPYEIAEAHITSTYVTAEMFEAEVERYKAWKEGRA